MASLRPAPNSAAALVARTGSRSTTARVAVLQCLLDGGYALSHQEIDHALMQEGLRLDRVTLYRTLDWLVEQQLAHKVTTDDRTWRFSANADAGADHAHFHCQRCDQVLCMKDVVPSFVITLPRGFTLNHAELSMEGICDQCQSG
jgi:Fur family ferric uptake transcriptional regulator